MAVNASRGTVLLLFTKLEFLGTMQAALQFSLKRRRD